MASASTSASFSIVRRLTALSVAVSLFGLILNGVLVVLAVHSFFEDMAVSLAGQVVTIRRALEAVPPAERDQLAVSLSAAGMRIHKNSNAAGVNGAASVSGVLDHLHVLLGSDVELELTSEDVQAQLEAVFAIDGQRWQVDFPAPHGSSRERLWSLLLPLGFAALVPLLAMLAGIRFIHRPMERVARGIADRYDSLRPLELSPGMGRELMAIGMSFNGLVQAVTAANQARRNMLAGLSHDLRTPLARLRLRAETECEPRTAEAMEADCDALARIIGQFHAYAQGEAGVSLGVDEPLSELIAHVASLYAERDVSVEMSAEASHCVFPDLAIQRIVTNLVDNAIAHGEMPIVLRVDIQDGNCRLVVRDIGPGILASDLAQAVEPFVKLRPRGFRAGEGDDLGHCGLGLAIVSQICGELGGSLFHRPFDGTGSEVGVSLPILRPGRKQPTA